MCREVLLRGVSEMSNPTELHGTFEANAQGRVDYTVEVIPVRPANSTLMAICTPDASIHITREQAKVFFGLIEKR